MPWGAGSALPGCSLLACWALGLHPDPNGRLCPSGPSRSDCRWVVAAHPVTLPLSLMTCHVLDDSQPALATGAVATLTPRVGGGAPSRKDKDSVCGAVEKSPSQSWLLRCCHQAYPLSTSCLPLARLCCPPPCATSVPGTTVNLRFFFPFRAGDSAQSPRHLEQIQSYSFPGPWNSLATTLPSAMHGSSCLSRTDPVGGIICALLPSHTQIIVHCMHQSFYSFLHIVGGFCPARSLNKYTETVLFAIVFGQ